MMRSTAQHANHVARCVPWLLQIVVLAIASSDSRAENWNMWRGPRGDGTSIETKIPTHWSDSDNVRWKVPIPGEGHASPIVWEDKLFVTTCLPESRARALICLDRESGQTVWQRTVFVADLENKHNLNSRASGTPATDGELVYTTFLAPDGSKVPFKEDRFVTPGKMVVAAYDLDGTERWQVQPGGFASIHGYCSSPVLFEDKVILNGDHDGNSYLIALDRDTGETVWKISRENKTRSYSTPIIRDIDGRTQMILSGDQCIASYDPRTGTRHWLIDGPTEQFVASMVFNGRMLFMTAGFPEHHMLAIRPDGQGNVTNSHIAWRTTRACSYVPSPIAVGDYFLVVSDNGIASCLDAETGERYWKERIGRRYSASLVSANGLVYFTSDDGVTKVVRAAKDFELVAENDLGEPCSASPAISQGNVFLRSEGHLFCIRTHE